jgi:glycosyltransferase involved in cell wall biosynthesis
MSVALLSLVDDDELRGRLSTAARKHIQNNFSVEKYVARLDQIYSKLGIAS